MREAGLSSVTMETMRCQKRISSLADEVCRLPLWVDKVLYQTDVVALHAVVLLNARIFVCKRERAYEIKTSDLVFLWKSF